MTKFRILSLITALIVLAVGGIYLAVGETSLLFVLPTITLCFWILAALQLLEAKSSGARGIIAYLPTIATSLVAAFASLGTLGYWVGG